MTANDCNICVGRVVEASEGWGTFRFDSDRRFAYINIFVSILFSPAKAYINIFVIIGQHHSQATFPGHVPYIIDKPLA